MNTTFELMIIDTSYRQKITELCNQHHVESLYLFGSATKGTLKESSDIDLLVKFKQFALENYFINYMDLKDKLKLLFNREIDLVEAQTLKNPYLIKSINSSKELLYG